MFVRGARGCTAALPWAIALLRLSPLATGGGAATLGAARHTRLAGCVGARSIGARLGAGGLVALHALADGSHERALLLLGLVLLLGLACRLDALFLHLLHSLDVLALAPLRAFDLEALAQRERLAACELIPDDVGVDDGVGIVEDGEEDVEDDEEHKDDEEDEKDERPERRDLAHLLEVELSEQDEEERAQRIRERLEALRLHAKDVEAHDDEAAEKEREQQQEEREVGDGLAKRALQ
mmetsp:Transcript_45530/g.119613  ORF Transcript_45530/g.119613 Transcript_45530/m.119613 type:complete len:238 (-) Transcript_45530:1436-2149(-)